jgi:DNA gyrase subunit A
MDVEENDRTEVLIVTSRGFGKRTPLSDYRHIGRGGKGVKAFAKEKDIGVVVDQLLVKSDDEILLITSANQVIRLKVEQVRKVGRSAKGVRLVKLEDGAEVIAVTNLGEQTAEIEEITGEPPAQA